MSAAAAARAATCDGTDSVDEADVVASVDNIVLNSAALTPSSCATAAQAPTSLADTVDWKKQTQRGSRRKEKKEDDEKKKKEEKILCAQLQATRRLVCGTSRPRR